MHLHKLIHQFKVLVDNKTFTSAAEKLFISQPTLTQNIQRLEVALEVSLLIRDKRNITLTVYGESLYQHACLLDRSYRQALKDIEALKRSHRQTLVLECGHAWSHGLLFVLMQSYIARHPEIRMVIKSSNTEMGQLHLLKGECDLAFGAIPQPEHRITAINYLPIFTTRFMLFCSPEHALTRFDSVSKDHLNQSDWVVLKHESEESEFNDPLLSIIPFERVRFEVFSVSNAIALAKQSQCILALPLQLEKEATYRGLVPLRTAQQLTQFETGIMFIDDVLEQEHKKEFIDTIISVKSRFSEGC